MPAEEDMYIPPGRKPVDREELQPAEDKIELGPPTLDNESLYRQQFAIQDFAKTLREQVVLHDVSSKVSPLHTVKPAIKNSFYIKEQRWNDEEFVEPDDEAKQNKETVSHVVDYLNLYKENPTFLENKDPTLKALQS